MIAANIAPGMNRSFLAEQWTNLIPRQLWYDTVNEAQEMVDTDIKVDIQGYDIDEEIVRAARDNAKRAGVDGMIHFQQRPVSQLNHPKNTDLSYPIRHMVSGWKKRRHCRNYTGQLVRHTEGWIHGLCT